MLKLSAIMDKLLKLPGLVDVHVHLREPGATHKEDFETGTKAAIAGGYTQVLDMPNNNPPTISLKELDNKINLAKDRVYCDVGFNFGGTEQSVKFLKKVKRKAFGLKVYMNKTTGPLLVEDKDVQDLIFKSWQNAAPIMVHAMGRTIEDAISLAKKYKRKIHICHITADQIEPVKSAKKSGIQISSEVCPHHLFLNTDDVRKLGPFAMMQPPLMSKHDQVSMWNNLDYVDMIATDHAPHTLEEKMDKTSPKFGVPGLETTLPLMLWAVSKKMLSLERLVEMTSTAPRKIFNFPSQHNTYVLVDTTKKYKISQKKLFTKCNWTPFKNLDGVGEIKQVLLRGEKVFENGVFLKKPSGEIIHQVTNK